MFYKYKIKKIQIEISRLIAEIKILEALLEALQFTSYYIDQCILKIDRLQEIEKQLELLKREINLWTKLTNKNI